MKHVAVLILGVALSSPALAQRLDVPVMIGGTTEFEACNGHGVITGLNPKGDNFLSVRSGPGGKPYREIDRLHTDDAVIICDEQKPWMAVVYTGGPSECPGLDAPVAIRQPYRGPCKTGWVHRNYVRLTP